MKLISKLFGMRKSSQLLVDQVRISGKWVALPDGVRFVGASHSVQDLIENIRHYSVLLTGSRHRAKAGSTTHNRKRTRNVRSTVDWPDQLHF